MTDEKKARDKLVDSIRQSDVEPYTALRWVGTLFKAAAIFLAVALVGEFIAGIRLDGWAMLPTLLGRLARTSVLAVLMWGGGDLVKLLIQLGNDVRAERILLARLVHRTPARPRGDQSIAEAEVAEEPIEADAVEEPPAGAGFAGKRRPGAPAANEERLGVKQNSGVA